MSEKSELGLRGEALACERLTQEGCRILHTRWHFRHLELDIVATDGQSIIFAEVKTRSTRLWGDPWEAVDEKKIRHMINAADVYMKRYYVTLPYRFDIFSIVIDAQGHEVVEHIKDAFYPPLG